MIYKNIMMVSMFLLGLFMRVTAESYEALFQECHREFEQSILELTKAIDTFDAIAKSAPQPSARSLDTVEDDLTIASNTVSAAIEACQSMIEKQRQIGQRMQIIFNENIEKQMLLQQKITSLEKEQQMQIGLTQQLFQLLDQILVQLKVYSDYMQALDAGICELITQQDSINQCITASTDLTL